MRMNFGRVLNIRDWGDHSVATLVELGILLAGTVEVAPDPKRQYFYEIEHCGTVYYVYAAPVSRTIYLLASWKSVVRSQAGLLMAESVWT
jgi:hypothetical protein